jgi:hypothetical protein
MGTGLLVVKNGFILLIKDYQFFHTINTLEREMTHWILVLVQKGSNAKNESFW